jgi:NAD(P)-dependent dehydrogenase (short-subunit alcohol dehydrogenase family)
MKRAGRIKYANTKENASIVASTGAAAISVYSACKAAVRSFARTFTTDLEDRKICVNAVSPGVIPSPGYRNMTTDASTQFPRHTTLYAGCLRTPSGSSANRKS